MPEDKAALGKLTFEELVSIFQDYFEGGTSFPSKLPQIAALQDQGEAPVWPLDLKDFNRQQDEAVPTVLKQPRVTIDAAREAIERVAPKEDEGVLHWTVRLGNPTAVLEEEVPVNRLRVEHLGRLVAVPGIVAQISPVAFKLQEAVYQCLRCGTLLKIPQGEFETVPLECYEEAGGCKRTASNTKFELKPEVSTWANAQRVDLQEVPEGSEGKLPEKMSLILYGNDLVGRLRGGNRVVVWGILCVNEPVGKVRRTTRERYLEVQGFRVVEEDASQLVVSSADEARIVDLARDPEVYTKMRSSIAPFIQGYDDMKEATLLQLFGGVERPHGASWDRGDIHQLIVGDPSVAKSQLLLAAVRLAPRGSFITAPQATHAGLTAYAQQENIFGAVKWVAEAGAMPLMDRGGLLAIDELDKMQEEDRRKINPALDPQQFSITKAGANFRMVSRVPVLAAANPKFARFDEHHYISEQIEISPDTLSRFDCIWAVLDRPDLAWDEALAERVLSGDVVEAPVDVDTFRKFIAYAKRKVFPKMSPEAKALLKDFYKRERQKSAGVGAIAMTARQLGALRRLAEASARIQLRQVVNVADAERSIRLMSTWMQVISSEGGFLDSDIFQTGISHTQRDAILTLREIIQQLAGPDGVADYEDIVNEAGKRGVIASDVDRWLKKWTTEGEAYCPSKNKYKLVEHL